MALKPDPSWKDKATAAIQKDPKKACVLAVLALVLAIVGGRQVIGKGAPASASAGTIAKRPKVDNPFEFKSSGKKDTSVAMQRWLTTAPPKIERNLFAIRLEYYPTLSVKVLGKSAKSAGSSPEDDKSASQEADELKEWHSRSEATQLAAQQLRLQTTVMSATPRVLINGQMLKEGEFVASGTGDHAAEFRVVKIEPRRVIVEREGIKLEILMK